MPKTLRELLKNREIKKEKLFEEITSLDVYFNFSEEKNKTRIKIHFSEKKLLNIIRHGATLEEIFDDVINEIENTDLDKSDVAINFNKEYED